MSGVDDLFDVVDGGVVLHLHVQPGAGRSAVVGRHGRALKVKVAAPPVEGRANDAVVDLVTRTFGCRQVTLVSGATSRSKRVRLDGVEVDTVRHLLQGVLAPSSERA